MDYKRAFDIVKGLELDGRHDFLEEDGVKLYITRPSKLSKRFKDYDPKRNFQIWLDDGEREPFKPNHLRVMIDLHLRARSRPDLKEELAQAFDKIFYGKDPDKAINQLQEEDFGHFLNPLRIIANLSQLFLLEQEYGYHKESKYDPKNLFYQGWVRQVIDGSKEIDKNAVSVARGQPPLVGYTKRDNKKRKEYDGKPEPLWYLKEA